MALQEGFIYLSDVDGSIIQDIKYASCDNITGRIIKSYEAPVCITLEVVAAALASVQKELIDKSYSLKIFDCYRPQSATDDFVSWSQDTEDQIMKPLYYPDIDKADLFNLGYFSSKSAHTRGAAVDLTIVDLNTRAELDMGTRFDFMDETSNPLCDAMTGDARDNRMLLRNLMLKAGFEPIQSEWWHFRYIKEPFPDTYFDFPVK